MESPETARNVFQKSAGQNDLIAEWIRNRLRLSDVRRSLVDINALRLGWSAIMSALCGAVRAALSQFRCRPRTGCAGSRLSLRVYGPSLAPARQAELGKSAEKTTASMETRSLARK